MKDVKYVLAYLIPTSALLALLLQGWWSYSAVILAFGIIPLLEQFLPRSELNLNEQDKAKRSKNQFFDWLLYLNLPITYGSIFYLIYICSTSYLQTYELLGLILSVGIVVGTSGINVGHELGHRQNNWERMLAKTLLLPALYMHFYIEHNRGHHKYVGTNRDPASAKEGESLYFFWIRSIIGSYIDAWSLEKNRLLKKQKAFISFHNEMIRFQLLQITYLLIIGMVFGWRAVLIAIAVGVVAWLLLETINYVEHYGLRRKLLENGSYERVNPKHSWNANFELGRIMLYELTRHSDHHYIASKKYQLLDHHESSPELPLGYPASMLMAAIPPLWFGVMDKRIPDS